MNKFKRYEINIKETPVESVFLPLEKDMYIITTAKEDEDPFVRSMTGQKGFILALIAKELGFKSKDAIYAADILKERESLFK